MGAKTSMSELEIPRTMSDLRVEQLSLSEIMEYGDKLGYFANASELRELQGMSEVEKILPQSCGEWSGEAGDSTWKPDSQEIPKKPPENEKTWGEILEPYNTDGVEFRDGEPDFSPFAEASVEIDDFSDNRNANFTQADEKCAEQWSAENKDNRQWSAEDVREYRRDNSLSWHERSDMQTLDLVPQEVHGNIPHSGGISVYKQTQGE